MTINQRINALREIMKEEKLAAFIFPSTDPHASEYVADHWKGREWISGFNGSAGTAVVTMLSAALWTDSRYFLAAEEQLKETEFKLMKLKLKETPSVAEWIGQEIKNEDGYTEVGLDGKVNSCSFVRGLSDELRKEGGITVRLNLDPLEKIWNDRPKIPEGKIKIQPIEYAGETVESKLSRIKVALRKKHCDGMLVSALDDIAWTLNLRGTDVHCNPVFISYLVIEQEKSTLFINKAKLTDGITKYLADNDIDVKDYEDVAVYLHKEYFAYNILMDADETNSFLMSQIDKQKVHVVNAESPIPAMKALKNQAEIDGYHNAMLRDGVAMAKFLKWLKPAVAAGGQTEMSIDRKLTALRAQQALFKDISFDTIAGYETHGAIVHYEATSETDIVLEPKGFILLDSGAQYQDGTTDITRTIALGALTDEQRKIYTLVLKGHIQLELAKFPDGVCGTQLDSLARECLWREGLNFLHGTGHGVGSYLCVHEGPHQIRMEYMKTPLHAGMTVTDEPGLYLAGRFGVRIENTLLIKEYKNSEFGKFLQMESLTLCPIDTAPIDKTMLLNEEIEWLNNYHKMVCDKLLPYLEHDEQVWLKNVTKPI